MKKTLSIILAILMIVTTIPIAFAAETPIAKIGDVEYTDFNEALANWVDGTTLVLLADTPEHTEDIEIKDKTVVLELNGHIMQFSTTELKRFRIWENGGLTIRDSIGTGEVNTCHSSAYINKGSLTIEDGTLIGGIFNWTGILTMTGGKVVGYSSRNGFDTQATDGDGTFNFYGGTLKGSHGVWDMPGAVVNFSGAVVVEATDDICSGQGTTTITGGTFSHAPTDYVVEGCDITENDNGTWSVACNHSFTNYVETTAPTCTKTGLTTAKCDICSIVTDEKEIPATNHKDTLVQVDAKAPTCTEIGWDAYEYCTACDYTTYAEIPVHGNTLVQADAKSPTCTEIGWDAYEYCTACDYTTYVEIPALGHADADNDGVCDNGCGAEVVTLGGNVYPVDGDITNTGIYIGGFDAFNDCYKAGDGYITIIGEGNNDTVITLYDATIDVRGTETTEAIRISGEDVEIRFFGENNIFADEEAISNAIGSVDHGNIFIGEENAVLNLYGNISACEVTVESGTINIYGSDEKGEIVAVYIEKQLVVSENAVVNIISGDSGIGLNVGILAQKGIIAEGELNAITLNGTETDDELIYNLIAIGDAVLGADTYSPYYGMEIPEDMNVEVNFIVPEGASVTVPEGITLNLDSMTNVDIDGELIVYGTLICTHTGGEAACNKKAVCDICKNAYGEALVHEDADGDYICDNGCGHEFEKPVEDEICEVCGKVHTNFFSEIICFFTRIINFIKNLFA